MKKTNPRSYLSKTELDRIDDIVNMKMKFVNKIDKFSDKDYEPPKSKKKKNKKRKKFFYIGKSSYEE